MYRFCHKRNGDVTVPKSLRTVLVVKRKVYTMSVNHGKKSAAVIGTALAAVMGAGLMTAPDAEAASYNSKAYATAKAQIGDPYRWGAAGPNAFDCSGLVYYSYRKAGYKMPRVAQDQYNRSKKISKASRRPGDLVFFFSGGRAYHVGFYAGNNKILHAPKPGRNVKYEGIWNATIKYGRY